MFRFVKQPKSSDFDALADHLAKASTEVMHPSLYQNRQDVIDNLRQMAQQPERENHQSVYHGLRLFVW